MVDGDNHRDGELALSTSGLGRTATESRMFIEDRSWRFSDVDDEGRAANNVNAIERGLGHALGLGDRPSVSAGRYLKFRSSWLRSCPSRSGRLQARQARQTR